MSSLRLRSLKVADLEAISALEADCAGGWTATQLKSEMTRQGGWQLAGLRPDREEIIGYIFGHTVLDEAEIYRLLIAPDFRGQGYGKQMAALTLARLRRQGVKELYLEVRQSNLPAISLYRAVGFMPTGMRTNYYSNPQEDAVIMRRTLWPPDEAAMPEKMIDAGTAKNGI